MQDGTRRNKLAKFIEDKLLYIINSFSPIERLLIPIGAFIFLYGFYEYKRPTTHFVHATDVIAEQIANSNIKVLAWTNVQFKTTGAGFLAGEKIIIHIVLRVDSNEYANWKTIFDSNHNTVTIANSESPELYDRDLSSFCSIDSTFQNAGSLNIKSDDYNHAFCMDGVVVFTNEGPIEFGSPMKELFSVYGAELKIKSPNIAPRFIKYQVDLNRRTAFLQNIGVMLAFFMLYIAISRKKDSK